MAEFVEVMKKCKEMCEYYDYCRKGCPLEMVKDKYKRKCSAVLKNHPDEVEAVIMAWEKPIDWSKVEVDTKILVKQEEGDRWGKRHFAKFEDGKVYSWVNGMSSYTAGGFMTVWKFAKLAEEGENNDE